MSTMAQLAHISLSSFLRETEAYATADKRYEALASMYLQLTQMAGTLNIDINTKKAN